MPTLSVVRTDFIRISKWVGLILGILFGIFLLVKGVFFIKEIISPTPPPPPTVAFGKLSKAYIPKGIKKDFRYIIDTLSGDLPAFADRVSVYKINQGEVDILRVERTTQKVATLGFNIKPEQLSDTLYRWRVNEPYPKSLVINIRSQELNLQTAFLTNADLLYSKNILGKDEAINKAKSFLYALSLFPDDIDETKTKTKSLSVKNGVISPAISISDTDLITVYFFQKDVDGLPIVYPSGTGSLINLTIAGGGADHEVVDARFFYQKIGDEGATYPILTSQEAFEKLKKGQAYIASYEAGDLEIVIKKVYLAYYMSGRVQKFLLPVIVFEGKNDFVAYVSATADEWIDK